MAFQMFWEILWALNLGFLLSAIVQAVVSKQEMVRLLPDDSPKTLAKACGLGAASSSCSYAAVALARSIFRQGANFTAAMVFELASTNLVAELAIIMVILLGWQFAAAEFKMEGHAEMDMAVTEGPILQRILSERGKTAISHYFVMDWLSVWKDVVGGLLIAGALGVLVPRSFWKSFFLVLIPNSRNSGAHWSARSLPSFPLFVRWATSRLQPCCGIVASVSAV
jgi:uncharacterized membrane protein YraQ (UPF0718 family)